jgi:hypothetical protein
MVVEGKPGGGGDSPRLPFAELGVVSAPTAEPLGVSRDLGALNESSGGDKGTKMPSAAVTSLPFEAKITTAQGGVSNDEDETDSLHSTRTLHSESRVSICVLVLRRTI